MSDSISIIELISKIKERPAMYIGRNSIFTLASFLDGVCWANDRVVDADIRTDFQRWIEKKYKINTSHSWASILHFYSSDENAALLLFFKEFEIFLKEKIIEDEKK